MATQRGLYYVVAFDPGEAGTGWAVFCLDSKPSHPRHSILKRLKWWNSGVYKGTEELQVTRACDLLRRARYGKMPFTSDVDAVSEAFELTQTIGGDELLSPVRINAQLGYYCRTKLGLHLILQSRQVRTSITKDRLKAWGFWPVTDKDEFAAVQHGLSWLRRMRQGTAKESKRRS